AANSSKYHPDEQEFSFYNANPPEPHPGSGKLLVFLPGHGVHTEAYTKFAQLAADLGYHSIILSYYNLQGARQLCEAEAGCYGAVRKQLFDGTGTVPWSPWDLNTLSGASSDSPKHFSSRDAVRDRLRNLLWWLKEHGQSEEHWGQFLANP